MRTKVGMLAAGLVASVLTFGSPTIADDTSTTTATTTEATTTTATTTAATTTEVTTTAVEATASTDESTTTTVDECTAPPTTTGTTTTTDESTTTTIEIGGCAPPTLPPDPSTSVDPAEPGQTTSTPDSIGPATAGQGPPVRGTQAPTRPIPPKPTTTTTTTTTTVPAPTWGLPANSGSGRRVVYSKSRQRLWVVDSSGKVIKTHLVSGRQTPRDPAPGNYKVWSRSRYTHSINNPSITWGYMVRFAWGARGGNIGFHEIPWQYGHPVQSVSQLGTPLSGGCVRQAKPDAIWMWNWAQLGTRVVVLG